MRKAIIYFALSILAVFVVGLIALNIEVQYDLSTRERTMQSFVRLACRNAIVGIQTTEQTGLDNFSAHELNTDIGLFTGSFDNRSHPIGEYTTIEKQEYLHYLQVLENHFTNGDFTDENAKSRLNFIHTFLYKNKQDSDGDKMFRPIQFGMTYVSPTVFKGAFIQALKELLEANGGRNGGTPLAGEPEDSIYINWNNIEDYITINVSEPQIVSLPRDDSGTIDPTLISLYGIDKAEDLMGKLEPSLGFGSASVDFYVYYDISISVDWKSTLNSQVTNRNFLKQFGALSSNADDFDSNGFARINGKTIEYNYRYVLTN